MVHARIENAVVSHGSQSADAECAKMRAMSVHNFC